MGALDLFQRDEGIASAPDPREGRNLPATFGETFQDAWSNGQLAVSGIKQENAKEQALSEYIEQARNAAGDDFNAPFLKAARAGMQPLDATNAAVAAMRAKGGDLPFQPMTEQDIDDRAVEITRGAIAAHAAMGKREQTWSSWLGGIAGEAGSAATDPYNIPMMAIPLEGLGVLGTAAAVGAGMAGTQAISEAANLQYMEKVQPGYAESGAPQRAVAEAGLGGALLGLGGGILSKGLGWALGTEAKDAANVARSAANIAETNPLPGVAGEAAHQPALAKAIDDVLKERPVDVSREVGALEPSPERIASQPPVEPPKTIEPPPEPLLHDPVTVRETLANMPPEIHDAIRSSIEREIDEAAKTGKALQIPIGVNPGGQAIMGSATGELAKIDAYHALADAIGQCALPLAKQAAE